MRLGIFPWALDRERTGIENYLHSLITNMIKMGKSSEIYLINHKKTDDPLCELTNEIVLLNLPKIFKSPIGLPYAIKKANLDLFHAPAHYFSQITPYYLNFSVRKVLTIHDLIPITCPATTNLKFWKLTLDIIKTRVNVVIADSHQTKRDCIKYLGIPEEKIRVIYLAADQIFKVDKTNKEKFQYYLEIKHGIKFPFILGVGTLEKRKNIPNILRAFYILKKAGINHKLVIVGKNAWNSKKIFNIVKELDLNRDVIFTGYVENEDLVKLYNTADLFVYPSLYEGFGLPPVEAMSCGCPVITSNTTSLPEVVGNAGIKVDPHDYKALANEMYRILTNDDFKTELSEKGLKRAQLFSWEKTARETWKVYEEVLE